jgi:RNA polymerase sigma-70 factor, ECF subfamily
LTEENTTQSDLFLRLLMANHSKLFAYIFMLVPNYSDAEDLMQEITICLMHQFDSFRPDSNFLAWARSVAFYQVLDFRKKKARQPLVLTDETLQAVASFCEKNSSETELLLETAEQCIQKLTEQDKQLVTLRYAQNMTTKKAAGALGISIFSVYRALERIHQLLLRCIRRKLSMDLSRT